MKSCFIEKLSTNYVLRRKLLAGFAVECSHNSHYSFTTDSNDIGKAFLRSAEVPNTEPEEKKDNGH